MERPFFLATGWPYRTMPSDIPWESFKVLIREMKDFVYIDDDGIESLYGQTVSRIEISHTETINRSVSGKAAMSAKLKSVFLGFLGSTEVTANAEGTGSRGRVSETHTALPVYGKLKALVDALERVEDTICFSSLGSAAKYSLENRRKVFFYGRHEFDAPQFFDINGPQIVSETGYLILQCGQVERYDESDDYYKHPKFKADMACSIQKMPRSRRGMSFSGHDAIYLRGYRGLHVPFGLFASVIPLPDFVQLKPYAMWL